MNSASSKIILENSIVRLEQAASFHKEEAEKMKQEFFDNGENIINGSANVRPRAFILPLA